MSTEPHRLTGRVGARSDSDAVSAGRLVAGVPVANPRVPLLRLVREDTVRFSQARGYALPRRTLAMGDSASGSESREAVFRVGSDAVPDVTERLHVLRKGDPRDNAARAFTTLNRYLADDDARGILQESGGAEVNRSPGREEPAPATFGAFNLSGVLDGVLIRIGGRDDTVPAHLRYGDTIHLCNATREMAKRLAVHLYGPPLRVHGNGRWERDADGCWVMKRFSITSFDVLDDAPLAEVVRRLRDVEGSGWKEIEDPAAELRHLRGLEVAR